MDAGRAPASSRAVRRIPSYGASAGVFPAMSTTARVGSSPRLPTIASNDLRERGRGDVRLRRARDHDALVRIERR